MEGGKNKWGQLEPNFDSRFGGIEAAATGGY